MIANPPGRNSPQVHAENYSEPAAVTHTADCWDCFLRRGRRELDSRTSICRTPRPSCGGSRLLLATWGQPARPGLPRRGKRERGVQTSMLPQAIRWRSTPQSGLPALPRKSFIHSRAGIPHSVVAFGKLIALRGFRRLLAPRANSHPGGQFLGTMEGGRLRAHLGYDLVCRIGPKPARLPDARRRRDAAAGWLRCSYGWSGSRWCWAGS